MERVVWLLLELILPFDPYPYSQIGIFRPAREPIAFLATVPHRWIWAQELVHGSDRIAIPFISFPDVPVIQRALRAPNESPSNLIRHLESSAEELPHSERLLLVLHSWSAEGIKHRSRM
jgi:hypothetical protein